MLKQAKELSKLHFGGPYWRLCYALAHLASWGGHGWGDKIFYCRALGRTRLGIRLVPSLHLVLGLAEHAAFV